MKPLNQSTAGRWLQFLGEAVFHHPWWFCWIQLLLVLVCLGYTVSRLQFSTDRNDLISVRESYRRQFLKFKEEFNIQENLFVLIESENREKNREFVERLAARLRADGHFRNVYYRGGLKLMGPKALLFLPEETLADLEQDLRAYQPLFRTYSQATNLNTLFALVNRQFRLLAADPAGRQNPALTEALPTLQRILDRASDYTESEQVPLAPDISTLFGSHKQETQHELYLTFERGRIYVLITQASESRQERAAIRQLRKWIAQTRSEVPGANVEITGEAVLRHEEMEQARRDTEVAALISLALTALIFIGSCRNILRPLMGTFCLLIGICYALGLATLTVGRLNILSITLVPILIGLAIDYGVHLIFRYEEGLCQGQSPSVAIAKTLGFTGIGVITAALAIAGSFYFMVLTDFKGMQEMGVIAGSGVIVCLAPMLTLLPLLLVRGKPDPAGLRATRWPPRWRSPLVLSLECPGHEQRATLAKNRARARIAQLFAHRPWLVLACGALVTVFAIGGSPKVEFDYDLLNLQSRGLPAVRMQKQLARAGSQSLLYCAVVADSLPQAVRWEQRINQLPSVARVISLVKYLTEDQERKLVLIREIKRGLGSIPLPELDGQPVNLTNLNRTLFSLQGYLGRALDTLESENGHEDTRELLRSLRRSVNRLREITADDLPSTALRLTDFQRVLFGSLHETVRLIAQQDDRQRLQLEDIPAFLRDFFISPSGRFLLQVYPKDNAFRKFIAR